MNNKVKSIARITPIEDALALWFAMDSVGVTTEAYVRSIACDHQHEDGPQQEQALRNLGIALLHAKARFSKVTGWYPVSVCLDALQSGVAGEELSQQAIDNILCGAKHFDVMIEAFTFRHPEMKHQAADQAYEELLAAEPRLRTIGKWAEAPLRRACADAIARLYGSAAVADVQKSQGETP